MYTSFIDLLPCIASLRPDPLQLFRAVYALHGLRCGMARVKHNLIGSQANTSRIFLLQLCATSLVASNASMSSFPYLTVRIQIMVNVNALYVEACGNT